MPTRDSMVVSSGLNRLLIQLAEHTDDIPENLLHPWPLDVEPVESNLHLSWKNFYH